MLIGDTGQLPYVRGRVLWEQKLKTKNDIYGLNMYREFKDVITLQDNKRTQDGDDEARF